MSWVRPDLQELLHRWREVIVGGAVTGAGLWLATQGGYLLIPAGLALAALGAGLALMAWRRMRFDQGPAGPGLVEVNEGQVGYLGPGAGGFVSLAELVELRLLVLRGRRVWRLKQADGQALLIPVDAVGAERLFDAFASLPGMDTAALVAALHPAALQAGQRQGHRDVSLSAEATLIWARKGRGMTVS